jgi:hypothetical protein
MNNLNGFYTGIVVDSTGYKNAVTREGTRIIGQVLVKINGVTPSRFDESYKAVPSSNVDGSLDIETAKSGEVLAYVMQPITGESSQGLYNSSTNTTQATRTVASKQFSLMKIGDSFRNGPKKHLTPINNPYGNNYFPNYPWNAGLGSYGIPEVNSRVIVGFIKGFRSFPIVLGKLPTPDEQESFFIRGGVYGNAPGASQNYGGKPGSGSGSTSGSGTTKDTTANVGEAAPTTTTQKGYSISTAGVFGGNKAVNYNPYDLPASLKNHPGYMKGYFGMPDVNAAGSISASITMDADERDFQKQLGEYRKSKGQEW